MAFVLKCMSFNLRVAVACDGVNMFFRRAPRVLEVLEREQPDLVGFQEVTDDMRTWLTEHLRGYTLQGCGRERNCHGESMLLGYRTGVCELLALENKWLSPTPDVPGSTFGGDQSSCPRMVTAVLLRHNGSEQPFRFLNTHLDHVGAQARYLGAMEIVQRIAAWREPFVLTGDFNATPDAPEIRLITAALAGRGAVDCTAGLPGTFHDYGRLPPEKRVRIDYIFSDGRCLDAYVVPDQPVNGQYYSDHNAVVALIELP